MKKIAFFTFIVSAIALTYIMTNGDSSSSSSAIGQKLTQQKKFPKIYGAMQHYHEFAKNQHTGKVEMKDIIASRKAVMEMTKEKSACSDGVQDIVWESMGPNNVGGRTRALLVDKDDRNLLISGGVAGGVFVSRDRGENWTPYTGDNYDAFMPVGSVAQSADGTIYVGTGEYIEDGISYGAYTTKVPGSGIWKSTDKGASFQLLEATDPGYFSSRSDVRSGEWAFVLSIATHPTDANTLFVGTNRGLYKSTDAGASFEKMDDVLSGAGVIYDVIYTKEGKVYALQGASLFKSDDGNTFVDISKSPGLSMHAGYKHMDISPSDPNHIYIVTQQRVIGNVLHSSDGGASWEIIGKGGDGSFNPCAGFGQCWYDLAIAVDPANPERIFLGGVFLYSWSKADGWTQLDDYDGIDNPQDFYYIHPDKHKIVFDQHDPNTVYVLGDGGISRSDNAGDVRPFFRTANKGYVTTQFYGVAATFEGQPIAGAQDNGTSYIDFAQNTILSADHVLGGDGGYTAASLFESNILFAESQNASMGRSSNGGEGFSPFFDQNISGDISGGNAPFITAFYLFENFNDYSFEISETKIGSFFTGGYSGNLWMAPDVLNVSHVPAWENLGTFGGGNAALGDVTFSNDGSNLFACSRGGYILRVKELNHEVDPQSKALVDTKYKSVSYTDPAFEGRTTSGVAMHPNNPLGELVVAAGNYGNDDYIWISQNANSQPDQIEFESLQKNLPPIPIHDVVLNPLSAEHYIIVATDQGVWSYNKNEDCWKEQNQGMGRLPVHQIIIVPMRDVACPVIYVGTHGKGVFRSTLFANPYLCDVERYWTRFVNTDQNETFEKQVKVYPNPASDFCTVEIELTNPTANLKLAVFNINGQVVNELDLGNQPAGKLSQNLNLTDLSAGTYMIYVFSDDLISTKQLIVVE